MVDSICWNMPMSSPVEPGLYSSSGNAYFETRVDSEPVTLPVSQSLAVFNGNLRLAVCAGKLRSAPAPIAQRTWQRRGPDSPRPACGIVHRLGDRRSFEGQEMVLGL